MSKADLSNKENLLDIYKKLENKPPKQESLLLQAIETLEIPIRQMLKNGYSLKEISETLNNEFHITISSQTLSTYLKKIQAERKKSLSAQKREATSLAKSNPIAQLSSSKNDKVSETTESLESDAIALSISQNDKLLEPTKSPKSKTTAQSSLDNPSSVMKSVVSKSKTTQSTLNNNSSNTIKSVVPQSDDVKTVTMEPMVEDINADEAEDARIKEAERLRELKMDKYYNKF